MIKRFLFFFLLLSSAISSAVFGQANSPVHTTANFCATVFPDTLFRGVKLEIGGDSTLCVTVKNCGDTTEIFSADIVAPGYDVTPTFSPVIQPDSLFKFCITFHPQSWGAADANLVIAVPGGKNLHVTLLGAALCAKLSALPDTLTFPITPVGSSDTLSVLIKNTGDLSWAPNAPSIFPNNGAFTILSFDTTTIPPGGSKKVMVEFSPESVGKDSTKITFPDAGPCGNDLAINLYGEGGCGFLIPSDTLISVTAVGGKITFTVIVSNSGNYEVDLGPAVFVGSGKSCFNLISVVPNRAPSRGSITLTLEFNSPQDTGSCCAALEFPNAGPCSNVLFIYICGKGEKNDVKNSQNTDGFTLDQNFPNPLKIKTSFNYTTPKETELNVILYDLTGKQIKTLTSGRVSEGKHLVSFDASNLPSGTYIYVLEAGSTRLSREFILAK